jgi:hypothetical protein
MSKSKIPRRTDEEENLAQPRRVKQQDQEAPVRQTPQWPPSMNPI